MEILLPEEGVSDPVYHLYQSSIASLWDESSAPAQVVPAAGLADGHGAMIVTGYLGNVIFKPRSSASVGDYPFDFAASRAFSNTASEFDAICERTAQELSSLRRGLWRL